MKGFLHFIDSLGKWSGQIIAPLALVYMSILLFEITARYVFNAPTKWAHELSVFIFGAQFMLGAAYCFYRGSMVNVEILHDRFPLKVRAILDASLFSISLLICVVFIWKGWSQFLFSFAIRQGTLSVWSPPLYPLYAIIPISTFLLLLQLIAKFVRDLHLAVTGAELK